MLMLQATYGSCIDVLQGSDETYLQGLAVGIEGNVIQSYDALVLNRVKQAFDQSDMMSARRDHVRSVLRSL